MPYENCLYGYSFLRGPVVTGLTVTGHNKYYADSAISRKTPFTI